MSKLNLMLSCGTNPLTRQEVSEIPTIAATQTHQPIPHGLLISTLLDALAYHNYDVVTEAHGVTKDGARYFGMFQLAGTDGADHSIVVGLRNSHDKRFPAAIAAGNGVFVCDNLSFSGEVKVARKHTRYILRDLPHVVHKATSRLAAYYTSQAQQIVSYKQHALTDDRARSLITRAAQVDAIAGAHILKVLEEWSKPKHEVFQERNVWSLFNAVTEVAKSWSPEQVYRRTQLLHGLLDTEVGIVNGKVEQSTVEALAV